PSSPLRRRFSVATENDGQSWLLRHARAVGAALAIWPLAVLVLLTLRTVESRVWTLFWCLALIAGCGALALRHLLPPRPDLPTGVAAPAGRPADATSTTDGPLDARRAEIWLLCLVGTAAALIAVCELVYVRDIFNSRMNTVFKLYFQA